MCCLPPLRPRRLVSASNGKRSQSRGCSRRQRAASQGERQTRAGRNEELCSAASSAAGSCVLQNGTGLPPHTPQPLFLQDGSAFPGQTDASRRENMPLKLVINQGRSKETTSTISFFGRTTKVVDLQAYPQIRGSQISPPCQHQSVPLSLCTQLYLTPHSAVKTIHP